jgi:hypothetical protein
MTKPINKLPVGILLTDLNYRDLNYRVTDDKHIGDFELWYTERFGWCIPTLLISKGNSHTRSRGLAERTYGIAIKDSQAVRMGMGPHVKERHTVYVYESTQPRLQKYLDLQAKGQEIAGDTRDRISSRRMATARRRADWGGLLGL